MGGERWIEPDWRKEERKWVKVDFTGFNSLPYLEQVNNCSLSMIIFIIIRRGWPEPRPEAEFKILLGTDGIFRSEERRVGKEC